MTNHPSLPGAVLLLALKMPHLEKLFNLIQTGLVILESCKFPDALVSLSNKVAPVVQSQPSDERNRCRPHEGRPSKGHIDVA